MAEPLRFRYAAIDPNGRRIRGALSAANDAEAFEELRREGLAPILLKREAAGRGDPRARRAPTLPDRESADFLASLADLLAAGADIRTSLSILSQRSERAAVKAMGQRLSADISSGESLERAFGRSFQRGQAFVGAMVAAGEAGGDLAGGLQRAADIISARLKLRDQLISVMAYPAFVFSSAIAAVFVILLFIVPSIAPLAQDVGSAPPASLMVLIVASDFLRGNLATLALAAALVVVAMAVAFGAGLLSRPLELVFLDGPARRTARGVVFGGFAISLGAMVGAGAPIGDALRLATRSVRSRGGRRRLEPLVAAVRQGQSLSQALASVPGFPSSVTRLAAVGEASNSLGQMLSRGGRLEEEAAMRRIETFGRLAGPVLIVLLGALLGVLMGGLLSGVSEMGQSALR
jgi:type II secretory pathway component PulF